MNKLVFIVPLLVLLGIGSVFLFESKDVAGFATLTIMDWQDCFQKLPLAQCDDLTNAYDLGQCYKAARDTSDLIWDGSAHELEECKTFYNYFTHAQASDLLDYKNYYISCFPIQQVTRAARQSTYYFNNIFGPKYLRCAGIRAIRY